MPEPDLATLVRRRRPGHTLEAPFYNSPAVFQADLDVIFGRHWVYVGPECEVPEPGDCLVVDIGRSSVLVVRDDDGQVRAWHNVCRHRGSRLVTEPRASVGNLTCRYHAWTYGLDGRLLYAEHMGADFDRSCHGLKPVHLRNVAGLLHVCLANQPPTDIDDLAAAMAPYLAPHAVADCKVAHETDLVEPGNWKLTMENNRECYHCAGNHPELTASLFEYGFGFAPETLDDSRRAQLGAYEAMVEERHAAWEASGLPSREIDELTRTTGFRTQRLPIDRSGESQTLDTQAASRRLLGRLTDPKLGGLSFWTQPNAWHHFMSDHIVTFSVLPLDAERTLLKTRWLVHKDAVEGVDYDVDNLTRVWIATNKQDSDLVGLAHSGAGDPAYEPGPYSPHTEGLVEKFTAWYIARMTEALA